MSRCCLRPDCHLDGSVASVARIKRSGIRENVKSKAPPRGGFFCPCYTALVTSVTFDTLKFVEKLKASGMPDAEAKAIAEAFRDAQSDAELVTKKDLQIELAPLKGDLLLLKWMIGLVLGGIMALLLKSFFPG